MDSLIYYIFSCEFIFLLLKLISKFIKLSVDLTQLNMQKNWHYRLIVFNIISFLRYSIKLFIEIRFCIVLVKVGVVPVFFIIDVFYSCWNLLKLAYKFHENHKTHKHISNLEDFVALVEEIVSLPQEENKEVNNDDEAVDRTEKDTEKEIVEKKAKPSNEILCGVCLDEIKTGKKLRCGHIFHLRCIK
jgi:hypothetical protein